jgi:hypothetical protein
MFVKITITIIFLLLSSLGCSDFGVSSLRNDSGDDSFQDEDFSAPANTTGSFLTSCELTDGRFLCQVSNKGKLIQFGNSGYDYEPNYIVYQSYNLFEDTPEKLEAEGVFSYEATSVPGDGTLATFVFNPIDLDYFVEQLIGDAKVSKEDKRKNSVGQILSFVDEDYSPEWGKKFVKLNRCMLGTLTDSWLNGETAGGVGSGLSVEDLKSYPYPWPGTKGEPKVLEVEIGGTEEDPDYTARWRKSLELWVEIYIDERASDQPADEEYTCRADYEDYKAGKETDLFKDFEAQVGELIKDFLIFKGEEI